MVFSLCESTLLSSEMCGKYTIKDSSLCNEHYLKKCNDQDRYLCTLIIWNYFSCFKCNSCMRINTKNMN